MVETRHDGDGTRFLIRLYLLFSMIMWLIGGSMAMIVRAELFQPGLPPEITVK